MGQKRSDRLWYAYRQSEEKFDYFMAALCSTLTSYVVQGFRPTPLGLAGAVELVALVCLLGSVVAAFKRIEWTVIALRLNHDLLYHGQHAGSLMDAAQRGSLQLNIETGDILDPFSAQQKAEKEKVKTKAIEEKLGRVAPKTKRYYRSRNALLVVGLALLVLARAIGAYGR